MRRRYQILIPFLLALVLSDGMLIGVKLKGTYYVNSMPPDEKIGNLLSIIRQEYVEEVELESVTESGIEAMLKKLDPFSSYIPADQLALANEALEGNFEGIGIEYSIIRDTLTVISAIPGGPSELAGIKPGEQIIEVNNEPISGVSLNNERVFELLRGEKGSEVTLTLLNLQGEKRSVVIARDEVPIYSIPASYMINDSIGYIKLIRFSGTSHDEFLEHFSKLKNEGAKHLMLDLRSNPGGFLEAAIKLSDEFLSSDLNIVYTEGRARNKRVYNSSKKGNFEKGRLVLLLNDGSASASEILGGAIQDNDRGVLVGRRTFGKGLVQEPFELSDHSLVRLTVAHYYTPSGRSLQKPYDGPDIHSDSMKFDSIEYKTKAGRIVYGGGGILPDFYVDEDSVTHSRLYLNVFRHRLIETFSIEYAALNEERILNNYESYEAFESSFGDTIKMLKQIDQFVGSRGVDPIPEYSIAEKKELISIIKMYMARYIWGDAAYYYISNNSDSIYTRGVKVISSSLYEKELGL